MAEVAFKTCAFARVVQLSGKFGIELGDKILRWWLAQVITERIDNVAA